MEKFHLQLFLNIIGIGSASGLLFKNDSLFIISDNSTYLYEYHLTNDTLQRHALDENPQENIAKKEKLDFESIALNKNKIIILGSGSTKNRNKVTSYHLESKEIQNIDFTLPFENFKKTASLSEGELNIEGLIITPKKSYFFQRGNTKDGSNGIFILNDDTNDSFEFKKITLPKINNIEATFTDAILVNENIYFLAAVENTTSTYEDGEILGTFFGKINLENLIIEKTLLISKKNKFEGITLYKETKNQLEFLLCEDNDTEQLTSKIYKLTINN